MFLVRDWFNKHDFDYGIFGGEDYMMEFLGVSYCCRHYDMCTLTDKQFSSGRGSDIQSSN